MIKRTSALAQPPRSSIMIDPTFHRTLKIEAAKTGKTIGELVQEAYQVWKERNGRR